MGDELFLAIVIPVFNDPQGLSTSLDSLLAARWPDGTVTIIVDDGSSCAIKERDIDQRLDITILRMPTNRGIDWALNAGFAEARRLGARYIARLDAGDTIEPERLECQLRLLEDNPDIGLVGSSAVFVDPAGRTLFVFSAPETDQEIRHRMHINSCFLHPTVMLRVSVLDLVGVYSTEYPAAEDYELFFRMLACCKAACLPDKLVTITTSPGGISTRRRRAQLVSRLRVQMLYFDRRRIESYLGIVLTVALLAIPHGLVLAAKRLMGHSRY